MQDVIRAIAKREGFDACFDIVSLSAPVQFVVSDQIDPIVVGMTPTPKREGVIYFSQPVAFFGKGIIDNASEENNHRTIQHLKGSRCVSTRWIACTVRSAVCIVIGSKSLAGERCGREAETHSGNAERWGKGFHAIIVALLVLEVTAMANLRRRNLNVTLALGGLLPVGRALARNGGAFGIVEPEVLRFLDNGWIPNNQRLAVLVYRNAIRVQGPDPASRFEAICAQNGWPPQWRNGIYDFHHFHPATHEVLGFAGGSARLLLGGPAPVGHEVKVQAGDVVVLPAGTGHCKLEASADFFVVGAYPPDEDIGISRKALTATQMQMLEMVKFPLSDPLSGPGGALPKLWS